MDGDRFRRMAVLDQICKLPLIPIWCGTALRVPTSFLLWTSFKQQFLTVISPNEFSLIKAGLFPLPFYELLLQGTIKMPSLLSTLIPLHEVSLFLPASVVFLRYYSIQYVLSQLPGCMAFLPTEWSALRAG